MPSDRRDVLVGIATLGVSGLAGCSGTGGVDGSGETPDATPTGSSTDGESTDGSTDADADATTGEPTALAVGESYDGDGYTATVRGVVARTSVFSYLAPDSVGVESAPEGTRFAFVHVAARGRSPPAHEAFAMEAGGETLTPAPVSRDVNDGFAPIGETRYDPSESGSDEEGWVAFAVPAPLSTDAVVVVDGARWTLSEESLAPFRNPAATFELRNLRVPSTVDADEPIPVAVEVENVGDGNGTCLAAVNYYGPLYGAETSRFDVLAGDAVTWETEITYHLEPDIDTDLVQFGVETSGGGAERRVELRGAGTDTGDDASGDGASTDTATSTSGY